VNVADNHFPRDFFHLDEEDSGFEIPIELSFQDGEFIFHDLSSRVDNIVEFMGHLLTVGTTNNLVLP
jgi:hypothetical protein